MEEKILKGKKNGMLVLFLSILLYIAEFVGLILGASMEQGVVATLLMVVSVVGLCVTWMLWLGLKVLRPQEALVLTLFGKYVGTLKEAGFYFVNPFCSAVNPASRTHLNQSGDVKTVNTKNEANGYASYQEATTKKISLKIMTLNNNRQKVNDCLGNPIEIGIAVTWRITDTAKAVFNVDNYKEFLSLQCDSALRNIVRIGV